MTKYRTKNNDMIDAICYKFYGGQAGTVEQVFEANHGLADYGPVLPSALIIELPVIAEAAAAKTVKLWD
jgi:phage tail protein X